MDDFNTPSQQFKPGDYVRVRQRVRKQWSRVDERNPQFRVVSINSHATGTNERWDILRLIPETLPGCNTASEQWFELDPDPKEIPMQPVIKPTGKPYSAFQPPKDYWTGKPITTIQLPEVFGRKFRRS